tara:strand:- start:8503 stop:8661 length:159 start_codon:yes stop_codon:yes gene_type:complete
MSAALKLKELGAATKTRAAANSMRSLFCSPFRWSSTFARLDIEEKDAASPSE